MVLHPKKVRQSVFIIDTRVFEKYEQKKMAREKERQRGEEDEEEEEKEEGGR